MILGLLELYRRDDHYNGLVVMVLAVFVYGRGSCRPMFFELMFVLDLDMF